MERMNQNHQNVGKIWRYTTDRYKLQPRRKVGNKTIDDVIYAPEVQLEKRLFS